MGKQHIEPLIVISKEELRSKIILEEGETMEGYIKDKFDSSRGIETVMRAVLENQYTPVEKLEFFRTIKKFVKLYHDMSRQTWGTTQWRGVNVCKSVGDLWVYQELIHVIRPDCIIETGSLFGGGALYLHDICALEGLGAHVISIDIIDRIHAKVKKAPIQFMCGDSADAVMVAQVRDWIEKYGLKKVMVILDSDHSTEHVKKELDAYGPMVTKGSILVVEDTYPCIELVPIIDDWLLDHTEFQRDISCEKFMLTFCRDGFLERIC